MISQKERFTKRRLKTPQSICYSTVTQSANTSQIFIIKKKDKLDKENSSGWNNLKRSLNSSTISHHEKRTASETQVGSNKKRLSRNGRNSALLSYEKGAHTHSTIVDLFTSR